MTEQEHEIRKLLAVHDAKFLMVMEELKQQRENIRQAQEKHDDADMREMQSRFYTKVDSLDKKIDDKFDKLSDQIHTMTIAAVVGFGAIAAAVGGLVFATFKLR